MTARENILGRIRAALGAGKAVPPPSAGPDHLSDSGKPPLEARQVMPATGGSPEADLELFRRNALGLKAEFHAVGSLDEALSLLIALRDAEGWQKAATHGGTLTDPVCGGLGLAICRTDQPHEVADLEACAAGITECDALIAQTGSVLVTSRSAGGRALSVLPPHHVVLARRDQLLPGLPDAFALLKSRYGSNYPSMISFITGPSRTGDIERVLVLGAHGPKRLTIVCVG